MITWWLGIPIFISLIICLGIYIQYKYDYRSYSNIGSNTSLILILILCIALVICFFNSVDNMYEVNVKYNYENTIEVYSLEDSSLSSSRFILGSGGSESNLYYYVMTGNDIEGYTVKKYKAENTYLIPEENIKPYYTEKHKHFDVAFGENFIFGGLLKINRLKDRDIIEKRELHLPKDYIKQNYNIDMK